MDRGAKKRDRPAKYRVKVKKGVGGIFPSAEQRFQEKVDVIDKVVNKNMPRANAAMMLDVTVRQIHRMSVAYRERGPDGLRHKLAGRPSNNSFPESVKTEAIAIIRDNYPSVGPTVGAEILEKVTGVRVSPETLRKWCVKAGIWDPGGFKGVSRRRGPRQGEGGGQGKSG
ncbi:MAG: hypothetical protein LBF58_12650 [Deltaproteobacteria bacterium]|jgi:transposase|nr:hypothetical protein [Deltaproteobacteria bacterium]